MDLREQKKNTPRPEAPQDEPPMEKLVDRLENYYDFECEGGSLKNCLEWQQLRAALQDAQQEIAAAREACPAVRMERYADAPLLVLVNEQVSQLFRMQSRAEAAESRLAQVDRAVLRFRGLEAQLAQVAAALNEYGQHTKACDLTKIERGIPERHREWKNHCTCGFDAIRQGGSK